jgi:hypothetical protein
MAQTTMIIVIVCSVVGGIALIAIIVMVINRRRRQAAWTSSQAAQVSKSNLIVTNPIYDQSFANPNAHMGGVRTAFDEPDDTFA